MSVLEVFRRDDLSFHFAFVAPVCCTPAGGLQAASGYRANSRFLLEDQFLQCGQNRKPEILDFFRTKSFRVASGAHSACNSKSVFRGVSWSSAMTCPSILRAGRVEGFPFVAPLQKAPGYRANSSCWRTSFDWKDQKFRIFFGPNRSESLAMEIADAMQTEPLAM